MAGVVRRAVTRRPMVRINRLTRSGRLILAMVVAVVLAILVLGAAWMAFGPDDAGRPDLAVDELVRIHDLHRTDYLDASDSTDGQAIELTGNSGVAVVPGSNQDVVLHPTGTASLFRLDADNHLERIDVEELADTAVAADVAVEADGTIWVSSSAPQTLQRIPPADDGRLTAETIKLPDDVFPSAVAAHPDGGVVVGDGTGGLLRVGADGTVTDRLPYPDTLVACRPAGHIDLTDRARRNNIANSGGFPTDVAVAADGTVYVAEKNCHGVYRTSFDPAGPDPQMVLSDTCPDAEVSHLVPKAVAVVGDKVVVADQFCDGLWVIAPGGKPDLRDFGLDARQWDELLVHELATGASRSLYVLTANALYATQLAD